MNKLDNELDDNELDEFVPMQIGLADIESREKNKNLYSELVSRATAFIFDTQDLLNNQELNAEIFFQLMRTPKEDLALFLKREYVKANNISIPGINMEKLISADLIDLPNDYDLVTKNHQEINELIDKIAATKLYFPLTKLLNQGGGEFDLNEEFEAELINFTASYTENETQNRALKAVEKFCDALNDLNDLKIIKSRGAMWTNACEVLKMGIANNELMDRPLSPDRNIFKKYFPLERFGNQESWKPGTQNRLAILS